MADQLRTTTVPPPLRCGDLIIDLETLEVLAQGRTCPMTARECALLYYFVANQGRLVTRDELLAAVWELSGVGPQIVDVYVRRLRTLFHTYLPAFSLRTVHRVGDQLIHKP